MKTSPLFLVLLVQPCSKPGMRKAEAFNLVPQIKYCFTWMNGILSMCCKHKLVVPCLDVFKTT